MSILSSQGADLSLSMIAWPCPAVPGRYLLYTLTVTNRGPDTARDVRLTCPLPPALCPVLFSPDAGARWIPWTQALALDSLPPGGVRQILIAGMVSGRTAIPIVGSGGVASSSPDPVLGNNTVTLATPVLCEPKGGCVS